MTAPNEIKGLYFPVLDHGFVALVDYMGGDESVAQAARVSYGAGTKKTSDDRALLRYLMRHRHTTPFEMVELKFHMKLPIFVARQLIRHRTASVNEYSGRYSLMPMLFYTPKEENFALQSTTNKQGRGEQADKPLYVYTTASWQEGREQAASDYETMVSGGVARELARIDLPLSMYTEWYWKIDLHNLLHFLALRSDPHAQWEIQQYSDIMAAMTKVVAPMSFEAWDDYRFNAKTFSRMELSILNYMLHGELLSKELMESEGMSKREMDEFIAFAELGAPVTAVGSFELDLSKAKPPEFFLEEALAAVPKIDTPKTG